MTDPLCLIFQDLYELWQCCLDVIAIQDEVWATFWFRWGPAILKLCHVVTHLIRAFVLVVLELLGDAGVIIHGLEYLLNRFVRALEHILTLTE